jgi:hypothetical protein
LTADDLAVSWTARRLLPGPIIIRLSNAVRKSFVPVPAVDVGAIRPDEKRRQLVVAGLVGRQDRINARLEQARVDLGLV